MLSDAQVQILGSFLGGLFGFLFAVALWALTEGIRARRRKDTVLGNLAYEVASNGAFLIRSSSLVHGVQQAADAANQPPALTTYVRSAMDTRAYHAAIGSPDYDLAADVLDGLLRQFYSVIPFAISTEETIMRELYDKEDRGQNAFALLSSLAGAAAPAVTAGNMILEGLAARGYQVVLPELPAATPEETGS